MLSALTPAATLPATDMGRAEKFYEDTLGLTKAEEDPGGVFYNCGGGKLFVYQSQYAGTNKATAMTFDVPPADFDAEVERLRAKGVTFQTFDLEGVEWNDGIAAMGETVKAVWFTDPDGNILNVSTGTP